MTHIVIPDATAPLELLGDSKVAVDISSFTASGDYISVALPSYQATKVTKATSFIDFTSAEDGDFSMGPTDSIAFSSSSPALPSSGTANAEARFPISLLTTVDKSAITGVRFRITVSSNCTFRCISIRACSEDWVYAPTDIDTLWDRAGLPAAPDGSTGGTYDFPTTADSGHPTDFPILFRADNLSSSRDPRPIDAKMGLSFSAGSLDFATGGETNTIALYLREIPVDDQIQLEVDALSQAQLDGLAHQPDFDTAVYVARRQEDLDLQIQGDLTGDTMFDLDRQPDYSKQSWIEVKLVWDDTGATLTLFNADGDGYTFTGFTLDGVDDSPSASQSQEDVGQYVMLVDLEGGTLQVRIYETDQTGQIDRSSLVFDTTPIDDEDVFKRRRGRIGWWTQFADGDAFLYNVRTRGLSFGDLVTKGYESITPVMGARLQAGSSSDDELYESFGSNDWGGTTSIDPDQAASATGKAFKIVHTAGVGLQGIQTNSFLLDTFADLKIAFSIKHPAPQTLEFFLYGEQGTIIPLTTTPIDKNKWTQVYAAIPDDLIQTGNYSLVVMEPLASQNTTWWIEGINILVSLVKWWARGQKADAWGMAGEDQWIPFGETVNKANSGVVFEEYGTSLQVRGRILRQPGEIHEFTAIPKYAELGRFVWEDEAPDLGYPPVSSFTTSISSRTVTFTSTATDPESQIVNWNWNFGDDSADSGPGVAHTYDKAGSYVVTLTVTDHMGNQSAHVATVTVS
jgi:hypothetical protein